MGGAVKSVDRMQPGPMPTPDPFLFCVYHKDQYPAGDEKLQAPRRGNGMDFNPAAPYRMYHGERVPGFPQHPHRGFETITATMDGIIDHTDSLGNGGRFGHGDLQWMTAGKGIVHGEMFPLVHADKPNPTRFFQIWLNLPGRSKMVEPHFVMHWAEDIQKATSEDGGSDVTVWAGELGGKKGLAPPPASWASSEENEVAVLFISIKPGATFSLPTARGGSAINRTMYFVEGSSLHVSGKAVPVKTVTELDAGVPTALANTTDELAQVLILQGRPIGEPVAQHGPFVMNTQQEIQQCFADYQRTQFGGWPWDDDAPIFPRGKGRHASLNGVETGPRECSL